MSTVNETIRPDGTVDRVEVAAEPGTVEDRVAAVEARLDKAAAASVTGEAAKLRDQLKDVG